jgi:tetratricopeptide (TPR) repeat protein
MAESLPKFPLLVILLLAPLTCAHARSTEQEAKGGAAADSLQLHLGRGYEALRQERYGDAENEFTAALAIDPSLTMRAQFPLAVSLFEQHKYPEARGALDAVRRVEGERPGVLYYLGRMDLEERNYHQAVQNLSRASAHPPFPDTAFYLGLAYLDEGSETEAEQWLKRAMEVNAADSRAEYELAKLYRKQGREKEAQLAFERSRAIKAQSDKLSQLKWACGQELDRGPAGAAPSCEELNDPNNAESLTALGILYGQHGQLILSLEPFKRAVELSPEVPQMRYNLAFTYFRLERFAEARESLQAAAEKWPDVFPLCSLYGAVLFRLGEVPEAYLYLHRAHQLAPQDADTALLLYKSLRELAKRSDEASSDDEAIRYLEEASLLAPGDPEPHQRLARIYRRTGRPDQAAAEDLKAQQIARSPKN